MIKKLVILLASIQPIIIYFYFTTPIKSFSMTWGTPLEPLFIAVNATTSYLMFNLKKWRIPSFFLMLLTIFSTTQYGQLHNIFATLFFVTCAYGILEYNKLRGIFFPLYVLGCSFSFFGLFWLETWFTYLLSAYHLTVILYVERLQEKEVNTFNTETA